MSRVVLFYVNLNQNENAYGSNKKELWSLLSEWTSNYALNAKHVRNSLFIAESVLRISTAYEKYKLSRILFFQIWLYENIYIISNHMIQGLGMKLHCIKRSLRS